MDEDLTSSEKLSRFEDTRWSLILQSREEDSTQRHRALSKLCSAYWYPLYSFLRRSGHSIEDAQDLVQELFLQLMNGKLLDVADPSRGKFRTLLLTALKKVTVDSWRAAGAQKRGGGAVFVPIDSEHAEVRYMEDKSKDISPDTAFDRQWAATVMERTWMRLEKSYATPELALVFAELAPRLSEPKSKETLAAIGERIGMSEDATKKAISRLRQRFGAALRAEVAETVSSPEAVEIEIRHLLQLFS